MKHVENLFTESLVVALVMSDVVIHDILNPVQDKDNCVLLGLLAKVSVEAVDVEFWLDAAHLYVVREYHP